MTKLLPCSDIDGWVRVYLSHLERPINPHRRGRLRRKLNTAYRLICPDRLISLDTLFWQHMVYAGCCDADPSALFNLKYTRHHETLAYGYAIGVELRRAIDAENT